MIVLVPIDFLFLGIVAKSFFTAEVGGMLGEVRIVPAVLFYLLYAVGILVLVDVCWGMFATALSSAFGLMIAN